MDQVSGNTYTLRTTRRNVSCVETETQSLHSASARGCVSTRALGHRTCDPSPRKRPQTCTPATNLLHSVQAFWSSFLPFPLWQQLFKALSYCPETSISDCPCLTFLWWKPLFSHLFLLHLIILTLPWASPRATCPPAEPTQS